ncbi:heavy metal translocating P-type ATPase [Tautonia sociabilis]|uniref:P-type Zn(2+) transporter n=1 Tax=Tautonia sociabilis TaxID=2080755 RepID=A0A432MFV2_9BACT|nr:heavy metal translocating P-type ATPase [Tautonia sociabilis]RUL85298.1 cadmium-translocating P-type ATPase [Tautonia sociabilis]
MKTPDRDEPKPEGVSRSSAIIAGVSAAMIALHLVLRFGVGGAGEIGGVPVDRLPLLAALVFGGGPLVLNLLGKALRREFGSDLLAGLSIVTSVILGEYLAGAFVVLMLSGGEAIEAYAVRSASSVLEALARRMPSVAHRKEAGGEVVDVPLDDVAVGDELVVFPHEICPVDGMVVEGHGSMDEAFLTGEPYRMSKAPGSPVISGAINGRSALTIRAEKRAVDSRYAKVMEVMRASEQRRPRIRRLGDTLGALYTPLAVAIALLAWLASGDAVRFLAVLVVATPCPLLIAIPVGIIGAISLAARRGIIIKDPAVLEAIDTCRTAIFDKTGTLTYGAPRLTEILPAPGYDEEEVLRLVGSLERYSKHPLSGAILAEARRRGGLVDAAQVEERPGQGLRGTVDGRSIEVSSRKQLLAQYPEAAKDLPPVAEGMECVAAIDGRYAATFRFRDEPRTEGASFVGHLGPKHRFDRVLIVSGDRESEVRYLADRVGIGEVFAAQSPEQKVAIVRQETSRAPTVFLGDGINDAPALTAATVGIAFGQNSDITAEAAGAVILDTSLSKVDEFLHISRRLRTIILQSALGGMAMSLVGMLVAAIGYLPPVAGAITQEVIDVLAVVNALRVTFPPRSLTDFEPGDEAEAETEADPDPAAAAGSP